MLALHNHEQTIIALREDMVLNQNPVFFFFFYERFADEINQGDRVDMTEVLLILMEGEIKISSTIKSQTIC